MISNVGVEIYRRKMLRELEDRFIPLFKRFRSNNITNAEHQELSLVSRHLNIRRCSGCNGLGFKNGDDTKAVNCTICDGLGLTNISAYIKKNIRDSPFNNNKRSIPKGL